MSHTSHSGLWTLNKEEISLKDVQLGMKFYEKDNIFVKTGDLMVYSDIQIHVNVN